MTTNIKLSLTWRIIIAMALRIAVGCFIKYLIGQQSDYVIPLAGWQFGLKSHLVDGLFHAGGQIFISSLKMLVVPLVFVSLVCGTGALKDIRTLGRIGSKTMVLYIATTP